MYKVTLERISNGVALRTSSVTGYSARLPEVGKSFQLVAEAIVPDAVARLVTTSTVQHIDQTENNYLIHTMNSVYSVVVDN